jgi:hypothetical protein
MMEKRIEKQRHELRLTWDSGMGDAWRHLAGMSERERREQFKFFFQFGFEAHRSLLRPGGAVAHQPSTGPGALALSARPAPTAERDGAERVPNLNDLSQRFGSAMDLPSGVS